MKKKKPGQKDLKTVESIEDRLKAKQILFIPKNKFCKFLINVVWTIANGGNKFAMWVNYKLTKKVLAVDVTSEEGQKDKLFLKN